MKRMSQEKKRSLSGYVFLAPWIIGFPIFMMYPLFMNLIMSFGKITDVVGLKTEITGFDNYIRLFTENTEFVPAFLDTLKITLLWTPFIIVFSLFLAILLNRKMPLKGFFRVVFFLPVLLGNGYVMQQLGPAANVLSVAEATNEFLTGVFNPQIAGFLEQLIGQIMSAFWKCGVQIIIFLSALQSIPDSYYEAAKVDNASGWECFWKITLPMVSPIILLNIVYTIIDTFRDTNNKIAELIVKVIFNEANYEYGATMGWVYFLSTFLIIGLVFLLSRRFVVYEK